LVRAGYDTPWLVTRGERNFTTDGTGGSVDEHDAVAIRIGDDQKCSIARRAQRSATESRR
jgi:hypothetical protein